MKEIVIRNAIVFIMLVAGCIAINNAPKYELTFKYKDSDIRVIVDDVEITRNIKKLPETAVINNGDGEVLLSQNTIDILFDKNLYYEEKYDTFITTSEDHRANIKVGSKTIEIDGKERSVKVPATRETYNYNHDDRYEDLQSIPNTKEIVYLPIKELMEIYDIDVQFKDKVIITHRYRNLFRSEVPKGSTLDIKYLKDANSKTLFKIESDDYVEIFDYNEEEEYNLVRTSYGELGYALTSDLKSFGVNQIGSEKEAEKEPEQTIKLAWDYVNPDASSIGKNAERAKIANLDIVAPTLLYLQNTDGEVLYRINAVKEYLSWANNAGYRVWVTFKNDGFSLEETSEFVTDMEHRNRCIKELIDFTKTYKVEGICIDFEYMKQEDAESFSQFIRELYVEMRNNNLILSVCVNIPDGSPNWSLCYQHKALSEASDYLCVMTYDCREEYSSFAAYDWVEENIEKIVVRDKVDSSKVLLGVCFSSALWKVKEDKPSREVYFMSNAKRYLEGTTWNETAKQYYYEGKNKKELMYIEEKESIREKLSLIDAYKLGGVACWCLGQETEDVWEVF